MAASVPTQANQNDEVKASLHRSEPDILVFISSVMNEDLNYARKTTKETVDSLDFGCPWAFEFTPASSEPPEDGYLRKVAEADFVIWLVGEETTKPVANEISQCIAAGCRLLVFKLPSKDREEQTSTLLEKVGGLAKWQDVEIITQLSDHIRLAFADEVVRALRDPTPELRNKKLREMRSLSISSCKAAWQALDVPEALAEELSRDPNVGGVLDYPGQGAYIVEGALGSGKTLASHRLFQLATDRALEDSTQPFPIFVSARDLNGSLRDHIDRQCKGNADPFIQGVFLLVDGVDERGAREGKDLLQQASVYVDANPRATVVTTIRPLSGLHAIGERIAMPALDDDEMVALINRISGQDLRVNQTYGWPSSMREAAKSPLFAVMIGSSLRDNPELVLSSRSRLIEHLAEDALMDAQENSEELDRLLHRLAACSITSGTRVHPSEVDRVRGRQKLLTTSRLVTESLGTVDFTLPIFREWYAARALLEGTVAIEELQQVSDRWLLPLSMALNSGDEQFTRSLMTHLTSTDPGLASLLIHEHKREHDVSHGLQGEATLLGTAIQAGCEMLDALLAWQRGLGKLYSEIGPVDPAGNTTPLRIGLSGPHINTGWYLGTESKPPVSGIPFEEARDRGSSCWSLFGMGVPNTEMWPWVFTKSLMVSKLTKLAEYTSLTISSQAAIRELSWDFALAASGQPHLVHNELDIQNILDRIAGNKLNSYASVQLRGTWYSVDEIRTVEEHLEFLLANQATVISDPWPPSDRPLAQGSIWKLYSDRQFLARTQAVFSAALRIYVETVELWFPRFAHRLRLYSLMPVRLEGLLEVPPRDSPLFTAPQLLWQPRILPFGEQSEVAFELGTLSHDEADLDRYFSEESEAFARHRHRHARDSRLFRVSSLLVDEVLDPRPATTMACKWLMEELRGLQWDRW